MAGRIFVNYRRDDSASQALNVAQYLEAKFGKRNVFLDIDRMRAGQSFPTVLKERLSASKVMLAIIGPSWLDLRNEAGQRRLDDPADWVRLEIATALVSGTVVIPVLVGGARLPRKAELPPDLQALTDQHAVTVTTNGFRNKMAGLERDIRAIPGPPPWGLIGGGAAGALALVLGGWTMAYQLGVPVWVPFGKVSDPAGLTPGTSGPKVAAQKGSDPEGLTLAKAAADKAQAERDAKLIADAAAVRKADEDRQRTAAAADTARKKAEEAAAMRPGRVFRDCPDCPEMVVVPAGSFTMGSPGNEERWTGYDGMEEPQRTVTIRQAFAVGKFEVTFGEWEACVAGGGCTSNLAPSDQGWGKGRRPVINISWDDAKQYVVWMSRKTGKTYRLLSEAEWEYAARAGTTTPFSTGRNITTGQANFEGTYTYGGSAKGQSRQRTIEVGSFPANAFGVYDMHGNVWEWVEDCWHANYNGAPDDSRAWITSCTDSRRVLRGGSWYGDPVSLRSATRNGVTAVDRGDNLGFRLGRTLTP